MNIRVPVTVTEFSRTKMVIKKRVHRIVALLSALNRKTGVRFFVGPPEQTCWRSLMVECNPFKVEDAGPNPVANTIYTITRTSIIININNQQRGSNEYM